MDKAPAYGAGDSGFESRYGLFFYCVFFLRVVCIKISAQPESNQRPRDINCKQLQSPALPTELYAATITCTKKKVLPGLEPGLQGSKPWVLTNYTIEPNLLQKNLKIEKMARRGIRTRDFVGEMWVSLPTKLTQLTKVEMITMQLGFGFFLRLPLEP